MNDFSVLPKTVSRQSFGVIIHTDTDIQGNKPVQGQVAHDSTDTITEGQRKRMYTLSGGNAELCTEVLAEFGYKSSKEVKKVSYEAICAAIEKRKNAGSEFPEPEIMTTDEDIPL